MGKTIKIISLILISAFFLVGVADDADAKKKKKKIPKKPSYVGAVKCNGSCHDPYYQAWVDSPHGKTFGLLKPGERADAKKKDKLDPEKDTRPILNASGVTPPAIGKEADSNRRAVKIKRVKTSAPKSIRKNPTRSRSVVKCATPWPVERSSAWS
jgi:hypothetical protein